MIHAGEVVFDVDSCGSVFVAKFGANERAARDKTGVSSQQKGVAQESVSAQEETIKMGLAGNKARHAVLKDIAAKKISRESKQTPKALALEERKLAEKTGRPQRNIVLTKREIMDLNCESNVFLRLKWVMLTSLRAESVHLSLDLKFTQRFTRAKILKSGKRLKKTSWSFSCKNAQLVKEEKTFREKKV